MQFEDWFPDPSSVNLFQEIELDAVKVYRNPVRLHHFYISHGINYEFHRNNTHLDILVDGSSNTTKKSLHVDVSAVNINRDVVRDSRVSQPLKNQ